MTLLAMSEALSMTRNSWDLQSLLDKPLRQETITTDNTNGYVQWKWDEFIPQDVLARLVDTIEKNYKSLVFDVNMFEPPKEPEDNSKILILEEVEQLYKVEKLKTNRKKVEIALRTLWETRKTCFDSNLSENDIIMYERVDIAIDFLLKISRKIDKIQQNKHIFDDKNVVIDI